MKNEKELRSIIRATLQLDSKAEKESSVTLTEEPPKIVKEAFVAQPKMFPQATEFLTQKTKDSHYQLYQSTIEQLNRVNLEAESEENPDEFLGLKCLETKLLNSVYLHENYWAGGFDSHSEIFMDSVAYNKLAQTWGTFENWQDDFIRCALCAKDGWVVTGYNMFLKKYVNTIITEHSNSVMLGLYPLIAIDLHEHAFYIDYQNGMKSYLYAMMKQLNWEIINERFEKAESIAEVVR